MSKKKIKRPQKYQKKPDPTFKEWWALQSEKTQKNLKIAAIAVLAVILALLVWYNFIYDDGSLKVSKDAIVGAEENWLISDLGKGKNSNYYKIATVDVPDGYVKSEEDVDGTYSEVQLRTNFVFEPADETNPLEYVYVIGVNSTPQAMIDEIHGMFVGIVGEDGTISDKLDYETEKGTAKYFEYAYTYEEDNGMGVMEEKHNQCLVMYVPTGYKDTCVLISVQHLPETAEGFVDNADLMAAAEATLAKISYVEK